MRIQEIEDYLWLAAAITIIATCLYLVGSQAVIAYRDRNFKKEMNALNIEKVKLEIEILKTK